MKRSRKRSGREGAAMVEFVICVPLLFMLFFAAMEFCRVAMIRHTVDNAVYEGCRVGIIPGATADEAENEADRVMSSLGVTNAKIKVWPSKIERETEDVTVKIEVPLDANSFVPNQFVTGKSIIRELTMRREGIR